LKRLLKENFGYLNQYKIAKQADVLMLGFLFSGSELNELLDTLGYPRECMNLAKLADYYIPRTANQSTLSRVPHVWVLSRLGRLHAAELLNADNSCERIKKAVLPDGDTQVLQAAEQDDPASEVFYEALGSDYFDVAARARQVVVYTWGRWLALSISSSDVTRVS